VFIVWFGTNTVLVSSAEEGQCVDVDRISSADATLWEKDCDEPHDAEIVHVSSFDQEQVDSYSSGGTGPTEFCFDLVVDRYQEQLFSEDYVIGLVIDGDEDDPSVGDDFLCYIERRGNDKLDAPL
jgi:hypothetical protein